MVSESTVKALRAYLSTLSDPKAEVATQIAKYARAVISGQTGVITSMTVNGKSFTFEGKASNEDMLALWQRLQVSLTSFGNPTVGQISFQITH